MPDDPAEAVVIGIEAADSGGAMDALMFAC